MDAAHLAEIRHLAALKAHETRREIDDEVRRDLAEEPEALLVFEKFRTRIRASRLCSKTVMFRDWLHNNGWAICQVQREVEASAATFGDEREEDYTARKARECSDVPF